MAAIRNANPGCTGDAHRLVDTLVRTHAAEKQRVTAITVASREHVDVDTVVDDRRNTCTDGAGRVMPRDRDDRDVRVDCTVKVTELTIEGTVVRRHDRNLESLGIHRTRERVVVDHIWAPGEHGLVCVDDMVQFGR